LAGPTKLSFSILGKAIRVAVTLPTFTSSVLQSLKVFLEAPSIGYTSDNQLEGTVRGTAASFDIPLTSDLMGKSIPVRVVTHSGEEESQPLSETINVPQVTSVPSSSVATSPKMKQPTKPVATRPKNQTMVPNAPTNPNYKLTGNQVVITVDATSAANAVATGALLLAPNIGFTQSHPVAGKVVGNKATFKIDLQSSMAGKSAVVSIFLTNAAGSSKPLAGQVTLPPQISGGEQSPNTSGSTTSCRKGSSNRTFTGTTCPPGWTKN
jgi:hypothetical protein